MAKQMKGKVPPQLAKHQFTAGSPRAQTLGRKGGKVSPTKGKSASPKAPDPFGSSTARIGPGDWINSQVNAHAPAMNTTPRMNKTTITKPAKLKTRTVPQTTTHRNSSKR